MRDLELQPNVNRQVFGPLGAIARTIVRQRRCNTPAVRRTARGHTAGSNRQSDILHAIDMKGLCAEGACVAKRTGSTFCDRRGAQMTNGRKRSNTLTIAQRRSRGPILADFCNIPRRRERAFALFRARKRRPRVDWNRILSRRSHESDASLAGRSRRRSSRVGLRAAGHALRLLAQRAAVRRLRRVDTRLEFSDHDKPGLADAARATAPVAPRGGRAMGQRQPGAMEQPNADFGLRARDVRGVA